MTDNLRATRDAIHTELCAITERKDVIVRQATEQARIAERALQARCQAATDHAGMHRCGGPLGGPNTAGEWPYVCSDCGYTEYR